MRERERVTEVQFVGNTKRVAMVQKPPKIFILFLCEKMFFDGVFLGVKYFFVLCWVGTCN